jgi:hypothetical protein
VTPAERYLRLSNAYCDALGGLRWSFEEDALVYRDGSAFAFSAEVALFLEGFASRGRMIHFCFVLHLLHMLQGTMATASERLCRAYFAAGRPPRNAGAFCANLCRIIPEAAGPVAVQDVLDRLRDIARPMRWHIVSFHDTFYPSEFPPLSVDEFEAAILAQLAAYSDDEVRQWMRHGCGPVKEAGRRLVRALPLPPPRTLSGVLAKLLERPRLAGARPFVMQMLSALALPPRQRLRPEMPLGGYADVTTQGQPDHLLPSQFALDEWDFLRRFADRELLYFRREDPHARTKHQLIVLLDQGVRTWGPIRLVLGAAVLALGRQAVQGRLPFLVTATSSEAAGEILDPLDVDEDRLGALVEASDLSANPGLALERLLECPADGSRDIVLLTHPRNLVEEDVRAAALRADRETRLLALTLDARGHAALSELRHGVPVPIRQFRVDLTAPMPTVPAPRSVAQQGHQWHGNVGPIGYPFRFGTGSPIGDNLFDFDHDGRWLVTATRDGMLHAWSTDASGHYEVLPRAMLQDRVLHRVDALIGVAGGFVVSQGDKGALLVAHYDLQNRYVTAHLLPAVADGHHAWHYSVEHHVVLVYTPSRGFEQALDLGTGVCFPGDKTSRAARAREAWYALARGRVPARKPTCVNNPTPTHIPVPWVCLLDENMGRLRLVSGELLPVADFIPLADARPALKGCKLLGAAYGGDVLAIKVRGPGPSVAVKLRLFRASAGVPLAQYAVHHEVFGFALSADGKLLARQTGGWRVEVRNTEGYPKPLVKTRAGNFSSHIAITMLGPTSLVLLAGKRSLHTLRWDAGQLDITCDLIPEGKTTVPPSPMAGRNRGAAEPLQSDPQRFVQIATSTVTAALDRFGQVTILDSEDRVVCMFFVFRDQLSGWMPDGSSFGPASPTRQPPTTADLEHFGHALLRASVLGRRTLCK